MNKCLKCDTEYEGKFCPECGEQWLGSKKCPHCHVELYGGAKFCPHCGYEFENNRLAEPSKTWDWVKTHKKPIIWISICIILISILLPIAIIYWYNGTYYKYQDNEYVYDATYITIKGKKWTIGEVTGTYEVNGNQIIFSYDTGFLGYVEKITGTIEGNTITLSDGSVYKKLIFSFKTVFLYFCFIIGSATIVVIFIEVVARIKKLP